MILQDNFIVQSFSSVHQNGTYYARWWSNSRCCFDDAPDTTQLLPRRSPSPAPDVSHNVCKVDVCHPLKLILTRFHRKLLCTQMESRTCVRTTHRVQWSFVTGNSTGDATVESSNATEKRDNHACHYYTAIMCAFFSCCPSTFGL